MMIRGPRILLVIPDDWPRALLRARLRDRGYHAVAAPSVDASFAYPVGDPETGPIRLVVLDQRAYDPESLDRLLQRHKGARVLLVALATSEVPPGPWTAVVRRSGHADDVMRAIREILPLAPASGRHIRE